ncbi:MAG: hypothetical protein WAL95_00340 [Candidatus Acidiferrales bacterium]
MLSRERLQRDIRLTFGAIHCIRQATARAADLYVRELLPVVNGVSNGQIEMLALNAPKNT